ncbi:OB-fold nucleic acid binding domain-containing protein [Georgenia sunbinii]|uniref:OB-fold nucleic acid binding domain-containing protein n=1 Tax=Georgenia sunbinii TaxID=3117728 RepID=UPI002F261321
MPDLTTAATARPRHRVTVSGAVAAVTYPAAGSPPSLVARLYDATGSIDLVWLGRRTVPGVAPGRRLRAEGMVSAGRHRPVIFNPVYQLFSEDSP